MNRVIAAALLAAALTGCPKGSTPGGQAGGTTPPQAIDTLPGHETLPQDTTPKEQERLVNAEAYMQTYMSLFAPLLPAGSALNPLAVQGAARGKDGSALFDTWNDYLFEIGLPDYRNELPRALQTNALMVATFERLGIALCDRAVEHDLRGAPTARAVFDFALPAGALTEDAFAPLFDVVHRTFLGYPAKLAPTDRTNRFFELYQGVVASHSVADAGTSRFKPAEAGWAAVCYGLVRHPEFHVY
jgi:hypothetical protein